MSHLLDANAVIDMLSNPRSAVLQRVAESDSGTVFVSAIAFAEVVLGSASGKQPDTGVLDALLEEIELLPFDEAAAREYSRLPFKRASFDRLIAAHAIATGLVLVTANGADFAGIPGLTVEDWSRVD